jgi:hypothetical protein
MISPRTRREGPEDVEHAVVHRVGPDENDGQDAGVHYSLGDVDHLDQELDQHQGDEDHDDVRDEQGDEDRIGDFRVVTKSMGPDEDRE